MIIDRMNEKSVREESRRATACLVMVSLHVYVKGKRFTAYAMPWDCFDTAKAIWEATKAESVSMFTGEGGHCMHHFDSRRSGDRNVRGRFVKAVAT